MLNSEAAQLLKKYREDRCSPDELALLQSWYLAIDFGEQQPLTEADWQSINATKVPHTKVRRPFFWYGAAAAAAVITVLLGLFTQLPQHQAKDNTKRAVAKTAVLPGGNRAMLTLSDGSQIDLARAADGELARQAGIKITKTADGQIVYAIADSKNTGGLANTISTPNGGQWQVLLPDGSKVFLNAASSLTYPLSFAGSSKREVALRGEGYFEVAADRAHPFIVKTAKQQVEVLGTHFNIDSYADQAATQTTLLEGSVNIIPANGRAVRLRPGQQATLMENTVDIRAVNAEEAIAWTKGIFYFQDAPVETIMKRIARWYDVDIVYQTPVMRERLTGIISQRRDIAQILKILEETNVVKFKMEGRTVIVGR